MIRADSVNAAREYLLSTDPITIKAMCRRQLDNSDDATLALINHTYFVYNNSLADTLIEIRKADDNLRKDLVQFTNYMCQLLEAENSLKASNAFFTQHSRNYMKIDLLFSYIIFAQMDNPIDPVVFKLSTGLNIVHMSDITLAGLATTS